MKELTNRLRKHLEIQQKHRDDGFLRFLGHFSWLGDWDGRFPTTNHYISSSFGGWTNSFEKNIKSSSNWIISPIVRVKIIQTYLSCHNPPEMNGEGGMLLKSFFPPSFKWKVGSPIQWWLKSLKFVSPASNLVSCWSIYRIYILSYVYWISGAVGIWDVLFWKETSNIIKNRNILQMWVVKKYQVSILKCLNISKVSQVLEPLRRRASFHPWMETAATVGIPKDFVHLQAK